MELKLRRLGLVMLAAIAVAALGGGSSASAKAGGHFVLGAHHALVKSIDSAQHSHAFRAHSGLMNCTVGTFKHEGTVAATTVEAIVLTPAYGTEGTGCSTEGGTPISAWTTNGCTYKLTVAGATTSSTEQTMHFDCPAGKALEFHQPNCLATMVAQTVEKAATYATTEVNGKHAITLNLHATFETQYHGGLCVFLGTKQTATLEGSALLKATNAVGEPVSLTAT